MVMAYRMIVFSTTRCDAAAFEGSFLISLQIGSLARLRCVQVPFGRDIRVLGGAVLRHQVWVSPILYTDLKTISMGPFRP